MLSPSLDTLRLFLHVTAAAVWVGGQFLLPQLLPTLRSIDGGTKQGARAFGKVAWPAFAVLVVTGMWSITTIDVTDSTSAYQVTLFVKILVSILAGAAAAAHAASDRRIVIALGGALGLLASLGAVFLGILLRTAA